MSNQHYPPAYLRYLKARLLNLGRPSFWVTAILLSVFGLVSWEYLSNPDELTQKQNPAVDVPTVSESSLSTEDRAAIADVDNLPALTQDLEPANLGAALSIPEDNSNSKNNPSIFDDVVSKQPATTNVTQPNSSLAIYDTKSTFLENNPFVVQADNLLRSGYSHSPLLGNKSLANSSEEIGTTKLSTNSGIELANKTARNKNTVNISPLEAAINQSQTQSISNLNSPSSQPTNIMGSNSEAGLTSINQSYSNPTNIMGNAAYNGASLPLTNSLSNQTLPNNTNLNSGKIYTQPTATNFTPNSYPNLDNSQPLPNGTPAVTSAVNNNISPYSVPSSIPGVVNSSTPTVYGNYGVQQSTQLPQSRISLPRPTPGAYGGVQINGYTYP